MSQPQAVGIGRSDQFREAAMASIAFHATEAVDNNDWELAQGLAQLLLQLQPGHIQAREILGRLSLENANRQDSERWQALYYAVQALDHAEPAMRRAVVRRLAQDNIADGDLIEFARILQEKHAPIQARDLLTIASEASPGSDSLLNAAAQSFIWANDRRGVVSWLEHMLTVRKLPDQSLALLFDSLNEMHEYSRAITLAETLEKDDAPPTSGTLVPIANAQLAVALGEAISPIQPSLDTGQILTRLSSALSTRVGFSVIRVGDGESRLLAACCDMSPWATLSLPQRDAVLDLVWGNWFGCSPADAAETPGGIASQLLNSCATADVIGLPTAERLRRDGKHHGWLLAGTLLVTRSLQSGLPETADANFNEKLDAHLDQLIRVMREATDVVVVAPHSSLAPALRRVSGRDVGQVLIPIEHGQSRGSGVPQAHLREYPSIRSHLRRATPGSLFLVAAGVLGKIYCSDVKEAGSVSLDIGALADAWVGERTRAGAFEDVGRLGTSHE